jgi:hypothetical protein
MIYSLRPIDPNVAEWKASTWRKEVVVRAASERSARMLAARGFAIAVERKLGQRLLVVPWTHAEFVECREIHESSYEADGPEVVLSPTARTAA